ncbi:adenylate kinase [Alphaproteobacteria bacterium]|nr:adenylate kinase [Alphaproteobacteria bacterium]
MKKNIIFIGPPGCGKGTQATLLKENLSLHHISTGAILRHEIQKETSLGNMAKDIINKGLLMPDPIMFEILTSYLDHHSSEEGFIFDGFPRTIDQAKWFEGFLAQKGQKVDTVIYFFVEEDVLIKRLSGRFTCDACSATYNDHFKRPQKDETCDVCGAHEFSRRADDALMNVKERLRIYHEQTKPLFSFYKEKESLREIDAMKDVEEVYRSLCASIKS